jgi:hypothetical protein
MLSYYYDINHADKFEALFGDLYIGKHPTSKRNSYLVLNFDFSGLDTTSENSFKISFAANVQNTVCSFFIKYQNLFLKYDYIKQIDIEQPGVGALMKVFNAAQFSGKDIYVIIDNYHFVDDLVAKGTYPGNNISPDLMRAHAMILNFYQMLKTGTSTVVDRIFFTGAIPISLNDIISGFNIFTNISLKQKYNEMLGFTQDEVNVLMNVVGIEPSMLKNVDIGMYYNGYLFHQNGEYKVYNPLMMLSVFCQILDGETIYRSNSNIIDENLKINYSHLRQLMENNQNRDKFIDIAKNNGISENIIPILSINELSATNSFTSLLFYMGLLTIDKLEKGLILLKIPNYSIRTAFWEYVVQVTIRK